MPNSVTSESETMQQVRHRRGAADETGGQFASKEPPDIPTLAVLRVDDTPERFGDVFALWWVEGLTIDHLTRPATLEFGADLKTHIETLIENWETNPSCWCDDDFTPDRSRFCPVCLGDEIAAACNDTTVNWEGLFNTGGQEDLFHAISEWDYAIFKAAFTATFKNHDLEAMLNRPVVKGWISGLANVSVFRRLRKRDEQRRMHEPAYHALDEP